MTLSAASSCTRTLWLVGLFCVLLANLAERLKEKAFGLGTVRQIGSVT